MNESWWQCSCCLPWTYHVHLSKRVLILSLIFINLITFSADFQVDGFVINGGNVGQPPLIVKKRDCGRERSQNGEVCAQILFSITNVTMEGIRRLSFDLVIVVVSALLCLGIHGYSSLMAVNSYRVVKGKEVQV